MSLSIRYEKGANDVLIEKYTEKFDSSENVGRRMFKLNHRSVRKFCSRLCYLVIILLFIIFLQLLFPKHITVNHNNIHYYASSINQTRSVSHSTPSNSNPTTDLFFPSNESTIYTTPFTPVQTSEKYFPNYTTSVLHSKISKSIVSSELPDFSYDEFSTYTTPLSIMQSSPEGNLTSDLSFDSTESTIFTTSDVPLQTPKKEVNKESQHNLKLFLSDAYQLRVYDLRSNKSSLYHEASQDITSFDIVKSSVFFIEKNNPLIQSSITSQIHVGLNGHLTPQAMAVDSLTKKFYILDKSAGTINVMDFEGKYFGIILSGIEDLHDILLDVEEGYMFILQYQKSILRINLDGNNIQEIVKDNKITAFTIDRKGKHILWADNDSKIFKADYYGKKHTIITAITSYQLITGLAYYEDQLFWILKSSIQGLWSCEYDHNDVCINHKNLPMFYKDLKSIKIFMDWDSNEDRIDNPCLVHNGNCSHFCLLSPNKRRTCACTMGYQLDSDLKSCKSVSDFILYTTSSYLRGIAVDTYDRDTFRDFIVPNPIGKEKRYFDYDVKNDQFYYRNYEKVQVINIKKQSEVETIINKRTFRIAFDWASENLYYIDTNGNIWIYHNYINKQIIKYLKIRDIVVDINVGRLYFINYSSDLYYLSNLDGSSLESKNRGIKHLNAKLVFDHDANKMYYSHEKFLYPLEYRYPNDYKKNLPIHIEFQSSDDINLLSFCGNYLYMSNSSGIWRVHKSYIEIGTPTLVASSFGGEKIFQMKVFKRGIDYSDGTVSECELNNGGCEQFCFAKPSKYCG